MVSSTSLPSLHTPNASNITKKIHDRNFKIHYSTKPASKLNYQRFRCKASFQSSSNSASSITDFDLYDLLGIDSTSDYSKVKTAYRTLQKRCHPDIAGPAGHDMAIILNEAYAVLSNPNSRYAYDKELAKTAELRGYTGKPLYSMWCGSEKEDRAVFVDELKCVGCLKCALFADKTFAIESTYGRARAVAQWADPEDKIQEAISACPVDCIAMVERAELPALEFLMSKQPRGNVRIGVGNTVGARVSDVFTQAKTFQKKYEQVKENTASNSMETDLQRDARNTAAQAIRAISNWLYWRIPSSQSQQMSLVLLEPRSKSSASSAADPRINKLRNAAAARKRAMSNTTAKVGSNLANPICHEEYWAPATHLLPSCEGTDNHQPSDDQTKTSGYHTNYRTQIKDSVHINREKPERAPFAWKIPVGTAIVASGIVQSHEALTATGALEDHIAGPLALEIVNSSWFHALLAGVTWYIVGIAITGIVEGIRSRALDIVEK